MSGIVVSVRPASEKGRLYPRYVNEVGILALESAVPRGWPFGINVAGCMLLDLDEHHVLANVDLHIPRRLWAGGLPQEPAAAKPGDLVVAVESVRVKQFEVPVRVRTSPQPRRVRIDIGDKTPDRFVSLSDACVAMLAGDELVGFLVSRRRPLTPGSRRAARDCRRGSPSGR